MLQIRHSSFEKFVIQKKRLDFVNHNAEPSKRLPLKTISNETKLRRSTGNSKASLLHFDHPKFS